MLMLDPPAPIFRRSQRLDNTAGVVRHPDPAELADGVLRGDRALLARAITLVESNAAAHREPAREVLRLVAGHARETRRIGISGVPGAGKSTFIEALGNKLCDDGHRVAVLAVDPSSSVTGGSILGDKTRMEMLSRRIECFIRPSPAAGALGGVARKTRETIRLCEAAGFDVVLVETVGVGQSEIAVHSMVDCFVLLLIAGAGDDLQGMKKGIFEMADVLVVNKADGENRQRAEATRLAFERVVCFLAPLTEGWTPPVLSASALSGEGIEAIWARIESYFDQGRTSGHFAARRQHQELAMLRALVEQELRQRFLSDPVVAASSQRIERAVLDGQLPASVGAEELLRFFPQRTHP